MREVFTMWRHTKMVVLVALTAAVYAAILIPLKGIPLIPGITELRPANVVPVVFSILFGPAAAWGAAFGNLIGDFFGTLGLGSLFGFVGNFFYGFVPYKLCGKMGPLSSKEPLEGRSGRQFVEYLLLALLASVACASVISWGVDLLRLVPFGVLGPVITLNNFLAAALIGPFLLRLLAPRAKRWNILWTDIVEPDEISRTAQPWMGVLLMWIGGIGALVVGVLVSTGLYASLPFQFGTGATGLATVFAILPFLVVFLIGCLLA
ncbi:MAG: QueT transporter family protein [Zetaproteobacteria bacterium]|nr:MAG: QueT transporter family protein [Zetaproteobacteria bacterium]